MHYSRRYQCFISHRQQMPLQCISGPKERLCLGVSASTQHASHGKSAGTSVSASFGCSAQVQRCIASATSRVRIGSTFIATHRLFHADSTAIDGNRANPVQQRRVTSGCPASPAAIVVSRWTSTM